VKLYLASLGTGDRFLAGGFDQRLDLGLDQSRRGWRCYQFSLSRSDDGQLSQSKIELPESVKYKRYRLEFRPGCCDGLVSPRVLIAEGATEATAFPFAARRPSELNPATYASLEALGVCIID
jgi:hypothetical protein